MPLVKMTVDFDDSQKRFIVRKAAELGISQSALVRMAVEQYLDRLSIEGDSSSEELPSVFGRGRNGAFSASESEDWLNENWARDLARDSDPAPEPER